MKLILWILLLHTHLIFAAAPFGLIAKKSCEQAWTLEQAEAYSNFKHALDRNTPSFAITRLLPETLPSYDRQQNIVYAFSAPGFHLQIESAPFSHQQQAELVNFALAYDPAKASNHFRLVFGKKPLLLNRSNASILNGAYTALHGDAMFAYLNWDLSGSVKYAKLAISRHSGEISIFSLRESYNGVINFVFDAITGIRQEMNNSRNHLRGRWYRRSDVLKISWIPSKNPNLTPRGKGHSEVIEVVDVNQ